MSEPRGSVDMIDLVRQHHALLYRYAYRLCGSATDAEDLTQETYLQACRKWDQLRDATRAKGWLCAILRNCFLKRLRDGDQPTTGLGNFESVPAPETDSGSELFGIDSEQLQAALRELPEHFRSPLILYYFEEFQYQEIAEQMDVPVGTIMSRLSRGKAYLRQRLRENAQCLSTARSSPRPL